ncbi:LTA synthase family protein [Stenotrophomonas terrae]|uniref:LTA synthase family protein n=1 Tax=Stenotrophomonas terrae TaxID=405446 RepID=UPI00320B09F1
MKLGIGPTARSFITDLAASWKYLPISLMACSIMAVVARISFGFTYGVGAIVVTGLLLGCALWLMGPGLRNRWWGAALTTGLASLLLVGSAAKVAMLHVPLSIADVQALPILLATLSGRPLLLATALISVAVLLPLGSLRLSWHSLLALATTTVFVFLLSSASGQLRSISENLLPVGIEELKMPDGEVVRIPGREDQISLLRVRGPLIYLLEDWRMMHEDTGNVPTAAEIDALTLQAWRPGSISKPRNVHVVLLESVWDITLLDRYQSSRSPLDPRFLALWESAGRPYVLSPEMGGATANAEFEVLCGLPAPRNSVAFVNLMRNPSPCIPAVLARSGYRTIASHAHQAENWNRIRAYDNAGFDIYRPIGAFELDDLEGGLLADSSFFRQNLQYLDENRSDAPLFNYLVSLSSHWGFVRNSERRPDLVTISPADVPVLHAYANAVAYTTKAFMDWTEDILMRDPEALIIAFGDHSPSLDVDPDPYTAVNGRDKAVFDSPATRRKVGISRTPLLILDGNRGALRTGTDLPMYELPGLIGQLLGNGALLPQSAQRGPMTLRPFRGHLLASNDGSWTDCAGHDSAPRTPTCNAAWKQFDQLRTLRQDIVFGDGHYLRAQHAAAFRAPRLHPMIVEASHAACEFEVDRWGPHQAMPRQGFNLQPDGSSAMWFAMKHLRGAPEVRIGDIVGETNVGEHLVTAAFVTSAVSNLTGPMPVSLSCPGQPPVYVGILDVSTELKSATSVAVEDCSFTVDQWGPRTGTTAQGFNLQPDGSSGLWITMKQLQGHPQVRIGTTTGATAYSDLLVTSGFSEPALHAQPGPLSVSIACPGHAAIELGTIQLE